MLIRFITYLKETLGNKDVRNRILFTLFIIFLYRLLANIPLPGIDMAAYQSQFGEASTSEASYLLTIFTGGQLETPSIVGLGIGVYITASIIMQLLSSVVPKLEELSQDGARGQQIIDKYTRYLTVPLSIVYSVGYILLLSDPSSQLGLIPLGPDGAVAPVKVVFISIVLTAGALLLMWLAELITERGIGNGASIILTIGILSSLPALINVDFASLNISETMVRVAQGELELLASPAMQAVYLLLFGGFILIAGIVFMTESTRKIPIQYARRMRDGGVAQQSFLPLKLNQSGVLPIIFASSLLTTPQLILPVIQRLFDAQSPVGQFINSLAQSELFQAGASSTPAYNIIYFVLIILFSLFYAFIALKPDQVADNLQKSGGFIPGIRPGSSTESYIVKVMLRLTSVGAIALGLIALIPIFAGFFLTDITGGQQFTIFTGVGGTTILIVVGVVLETIRQIESVKATQDYERFI